IRPASTSLGTTEALSDIQRLLNSSAQRRKALPTNKAFDGDKEEFAIWRWILELKLRVDASFIEGMVEQ
ncbi:hypothetical protein E4U31_007754, partial [Claviceps sp. LM219 group G6]